MFLLFQGGIFRFHVCFQGCIFDNQENWSWSWVNQMQIHTFSKRQQAVKTAWLFGKTGGRWLQIEKDGLIESRLGGRLGSKQMIVIYHMIWETYVCNRCKTSGTKGFWFHVFIPAVLLVSVRSAVHLTFPSESMADTGFPVQCHIPANTLQRSKDSANRFGSSVAFWRVISYTYFIRSPTSPGN